MRLATLAVCAFCAWVSAAAELQVSVAKAGGSGPASVVLTWDATGYDCVVVPGLGKLPLTGSRPVAPEPDGSILIIADGPHGTSARRLSVGTIPAKGDEQDYESDLGCFRYAVDVNLPGRLFGETVDLLKRRLQGQFGFLTRYTKITDSFIQIETNRWKTPGLLMNLGPQYAGRRISFLVNIVAAKSGPPAVELRSYIEYTRILESTPYPERDDQLYNDQATRMKRSLEQ